MLERFDAGRALEAEDWRTSGALAWALLRSKGQLPQTRALANGPMRSHFAGRDADALIDSATDLSASLRAVGATTSPATTSPTRVLMARAIEGSVLSKLQRARRVRFHSSGKALLLGSGSGWVRYEGESVPVVRSEFASLALPERVVAALTWWTDWVDSDLPDAGDAFASEVTTELVREVNGAFSGDGAGDEREPTGIGYVASSIASTGDTADDIANDIAAAVKRISEAGYSADTIVASESAANIIALKLPAAAPVERVGTMRLATGPGVVGVLVLDSSRIALALGDRVVLSSSGESDVEVAGTTSVDAQRVSTFQTNTRLLMGLLAANFTLVASEDSGGSLAAVRITGASYV